MAGSDNYFQNFVRIIEPQQVHNMDGNHPYQNQDPHRIWNSVVSAENLPQPNEEQNKETQNYSHYPQHPLYCNALTSLTPTQHHHHHQQQQPSTLDLIPPPPLQHHQPQIPEVHQYEQRQHRSPWESILPQERQLSPFDAALQEMHEMILQQNNNIGRHHHYHHQCQHRPHHHHFHYHHHCHHCHQYVDTTQPFGTLPTNFYNAAHINQLRHHRDHHHEYVYPEYPLHPSPVGMEYFHSYFYPSPFDIELFWLAQRTFHVAQCRFALLNSQVHRHSHTHGHPYRTLRVHYHQEATTPAINEGFLPNHLSIQPHSLYELNPPSFEEHHAYENVTLPHVLQERMAIADSLINSSRYQIDIQNELTLPNFHQAEDFHYENLLSLDDHLDEFNRRGLDQNEIDRLHQYIFDPTEFEGDRTSCVICMCDFESTEILRVLPCSHEFHATCVDRWLQSNRTCPICRDNVFNYF